MTNTIIEKLNRLADMQSHADVMNIHFDQLRNEILTPEIRQQLDEIEAERNTSLDALNGGMAGLQAEIKEAVTQHGATVKGAHLMAVWSKPRVSWDTKSLDGYAAAHPEIAQFRKEGKPSVAIKNVGG